MEIHLGVGQIVYLFDIFSNILAPLHLKYIILSSDNCFSLALYSAFAAFVHFQHFHDVSQYYSLNSFFKVLYQTATIQCNVEIYTSTNAKYYYFGIK